jgi:hypothetical protein
MLCYIMLCYVMLCYAMLCYVSTVGIKKMSSAFDPRNDTENFGAKVLNNLNTIKRMPNGYLPLNFIPMKYKEILSCKR